MPMILTEAQEYVLRVKIWDFIHSLPLTIELTEPDKTYLVEELIRQIEKRATQRG